MEQQPTEQSKFNAGVSKSQEIRAQLNAINLSRLNPLAMDLELSIYNFEAIHKRLINLFFEVRSKCGETELGKLERLKTLCENCFKNKNPFVSQKTRDGLQKVLDNKNLDFLISCLELFESSIRQSLAAHGFDTENKMNIGEAIVSN
jgi:hypothetical protein